MKRFFAVSAMIIFVNESISMDYSRRPKRKAALVCADTLERRLKKQRVEDREIIQATQKAESYFEQPLLHQVSAHKTDLLPVIIKEDISFWEYELFKAHKNVQTMGDFLVNLHEVAEAEGVVEKACLNARWQLLFESLETVIDGGNAGFKAYEEHNTKK